MARSTRSAIFAGRSPMPVVTASSPRGSISITMVPLVLFGLGRGGACLLKKVESAEET
jgi:hypothetical protein